MTTTQESRGGILGFLTTIPGIITACAALITAIGTVYVTNGDGSEPDPPQPVHVVQSPAAPEPTTQSTLAPSSPNDQDPVPAPPPDEDVSEIDVSALAGMSVSDPVQTTLENCGNGDLVACAAVLEALAQECYDGYLLSCDVLYQVSPVGSAYEWYGGTCGGYFADLSYAGVCSEP